MNQKKPAIGEKIGKYLLINEIGKGGMAVIFEALHETLQRRCAIKIMLPTQKTAEVAVRFQQEYNALSRLEHPNVLKVIESGIHQEQPYFAMELLQGKTLKEEVQDWGTLTPTARFTKARHILIQITKALDYIHQLGWVHRDITPGNIMILTTGDIKIMDFGVVKIPGNELTAVGEMIGTVAYMSPEQIKGEQVDARADLYSLGTCLYLMLTGKRPFSARTLPGYLDKHLNHKPTPLHQHSPMVPQDLSSACLRLLEKDPNLRFSSANHLLSYLAPQEKAERIRLVGRTWEISLLREHIARLEDAKGGVLIIQGDRGMGCSSLIKEARRLCHQTGNLSIYTNNQSPDQSSFYGVQTLFRRLGETIQKDNIINQIFDDGATFEKWSVFAAIRDLLKDSQVKLIAIDNIDNSDSGTLELAEYLIRNLAEDTLFVLGIHDPTWKPIQGILTGTSTSYQPSIIELKPISIAAIEEWLLLWASYDDSIEPLAQRIHSKSGGNPTLVHEMVRDIRIRKNIVPQKRLPLGMSVQEIERAQFALPKNLKEATLLRLKSISPEAKVILSLIASYRGRLSHDLMFEALNQLPSFQENREGILKSLHELQEVSLIDSYKENGELFYFMQHNWVRDILNSLIPNSTPYHIAIGKALEIQNYTSPGPMLEDLAYHFEQGKLFGKAYTYLFQASQKLRRHTLVLEAKHYLDRALIIEPIAREHLTLADAEFRLSKLFLERSIVYNILSDKEEAMAQIAKAQTHAVRLQNSELLAQIYTEQSHQYRESYALEDAEGVLSLALEAAQNAGIPKLEIVPYYEFGAIQWDKGNLSAAQKFFRKAQDLAEQLNHPEGSALSSNGLGVLAMCQGQSANARRHFEQAIRVGKENGMIESLVNSRTNLAELHYCMGNFRKSLSLINEAIIEAREVSYRQGIAVALRYRASLLCDLGQNLEAEENSKTAIKIQKSLQNPHEELASIISLLRIWVPTQKEEIIFSHLEHGLALCQKYDAEGNLPILQAWKSLMLFRTGKAEAARQLLFEIRVEEGKTWLHQKARCYLEIAKAWLAMDHKEQAEKNAAQALGIADNSGYRFYALQARIILSRTLSSKTKRERHTRIAQSLSKSLSANLSPSDAQSFLTIHGGLK
ncbi:MAG: protein kinase [Myxococcota bacterium]|nr:protein kinase [Myxococcota bacterium]